MTEYRDDTEYVQRRVDEAAEKGEVCKFDGVPMYISRDIVVPANCRGVEGATLVRIDAEVVVKDLRRA